MTESADKVKQAVALITAITALVTAGTSLVKALDKSVERVSYETLSEKIVELQKEVTSLKQGATDYMPYDPPDTSMCAPPNDLDHDGLKSDLDDPTPLLIQPKPSASSAPSLPPLEPLIVAPTPPPPWSAIEVKAQN